MNETQKYLDTYIAPHEIHGFSIFEDDHPSQN